MRYFILLLVLFIASCSSDEQENSNAGKRPFVEGEGAGAMVSTTNMRHWKNYRSGAFSIQHPRGWKVTGPNGRGQVFLSSRDKEKIMIWPLYIPYPMQFGAAQQLMEEMLPALDGKMRWQSPQPEGQNWIRAEGQHRNLAAVAVLRWVPLGNASAGFLYYLSGPPEVFNKHEDTYARIVQSFRVNANKGGRRASGSRSAPRFQFVRWYEPNENSGSFEIPRGWGIRGGLVRRSAIDITFAATLRSPDGQIEVFIGDPQIPQFVVPNQMTWMSGMGEGSWYTYTDGTRALIQRYQPGTMFARNYAAQRYGRQLAQFQITRAQERPDISREINRISQQFGAWGVQSQLSTGEIFFKCMAGSRPLVGYTFAGTSLTQSPSMGIGVWSVQNLYGYITPPQREAEAQAVLRHIIASTRLNPDWVRSQRNMTAATVQITNQTNRYISDQIIGSYERRQASQDRMARNFSNYLRGVEDVMDPATGRTYQVQSGSNYYWINDLETKIGNNLGYNPDPMQFRQMIRLGQ